MRFTKKHPWVARLWAALLVSALVFSLLPTASVMAQDEEEEGPTPVLIFPVHQAQFLSGAGYDFRVEVHAEELPSDFEVTINGEAAADFFGSEGESESWQFSSEASSEEDLEDVDPDTIVTSHSVIWRGLSAPEAGEYIVSVVADGNENIAEWTVREPSESAGARNVMLFIADGGSTAVYTAARLLSRGMDQGTYNSNLVFEDFEEIGFLHTSGIDSIITDSANSASSYNTGHKTAVNANGVYPDTSYDRFDNPRTEKFAYMIKRTMGMSVGIVTDSNWADATPNGVYGYGRDRSNAALNMYMTQPLDEGLMPEVILGGGGRNMLPQSADGSRRGDDRDLFQEYEDAGYTVVTSGSELAEVDGASHLLGIFHSNHMNVWLDRNIYTDNLGDFPDQPGMVDMVTTAIDVLSQNENGFYLQVEAANIDKQLHPNDWDRAMADTIEFDRAIAAAVEWAEENAPDTLIIVTSDHAHGYDVYGTVDTEAFNAGVSDFQKRNAINIYSNAGFPTYEDADGDFFPDDWAPSITLAQGKVDNPPFTEDFQVSEVPRRPSLRASLDDEGEVRISADNPDDDPNGLPMGGNLPEGSTSSVHTLQSVPIYAHGPGSDCLGRVIENREVFFCMAAAIGLNPGE